MRHDRQAYSAFHDIQDARGGIPLNEDLCRRWVFVALGSSLPILDPGAEVYTARTFSAKRYDSNVLNSFGHPVPRVAGKLQSPGRQAAAKILKTEFTDAKDTLVMDIRSCYDVPELTKLVRTFVFSREGRGSLTVSADAPLHVTLDIGGAQLLDERLHVGLRRRLRLRPGRRQLSAQCGDTLRQRLLHAGSADRLAAAASAEVPSTCRERWGLPFLRVLGHGHGRPAGRW